ncbi:MAG: histidinol-phosphate transaminase [Turicibacter sp.]|nr:histidinol-phosphate transaminase [Turicibacter sp.]
MFVKPQLKTLNAYVPGKTTAAIKKEHGLGHVIKLASNENPYGASPLAIKAYQNFTDFSIYPDGSVLALREKTAKFLGVEPNQLLFGAGADEVIQMVSRAILSKGDNIVLADDTFIQYRHHAVIEGAESKIVPLIGGTHDLEGMLKAIDPFTRMVWVCNPNNPTGTYVNSHALEAFLHQVPDNVLVILDEAYLEYAVAEDFPKSIPLVNKFKNLLILRTFSKAYGLAAFRIGYGVGAGELIAGFETARLPFNTTAPSQEAAMAALADQGFVAQCAAKNREAMALLEGFLNKKGIAYYPSQANFLFIPLNNSREIAAFLESIGIIVRPFPTGLRISIGTKEEISELIGGLGQWFGKAVEGVIK